MKVLIFAQRRADGGCFDPSVLRWPHRALDRQNQEDVMHESHGSPKVSGESKGVKNYSRNQHPCPGTGGGGMCLKKIPDPFEFP
jgi:hypothetical protein